MVYSKETKQDMANVMNYMFNVPFETVPKVLIEQFSNTRFLYNDYLLFCPLYNDLPTYWNIAIFDASSMIAFVWGTLEPLEKFFHVVRVTIHPSARHSDVNVLSYLVDAVKDLAKKVGVYYVFGITDRQDVFVGKVPKQIKFPNSKVMEVDLNEDLQ